MIDLTISDYRIIEKLGEGGMGVVYKAIDTKLERTVALKFLAPHLVSNDESRQRFIREAKAAAALQHPNICTVYEIDEVDGRTFIATAYLEGEELTKRIEKGPLSVGRLLNIAIQVARGLQEAHSKGVVHRDIKPANIMDTTTGQAVLMDFGLAQIASAASKLTREGTTVGTSAYMSPEQTTGEKTDHRTDFRYNSLHSRPKGTQQQTNRSRYPDLRRPRGEPSRQRLDRRSNPKQLSKPNYGGHPSLRCRYERASAGRLTSLDAS